MNKRPPGRDRRLSRTTLGELLRLAPDGRLLQTVPLPVRCPTMPAFGDADLRTLYVTTASAGRPEEERARQPLAGRVLRLRVRVPGLPVRFAHLT